MLFHIALFTADVYFFSCRTGTAGFFGVYAKSFLWHVRHVNFLACVVRTFFQHVWHVKFWARRTSMARRFFQHVWHIEHVEKPKCWARTASKQCRARQKFCYVGQVGTRHLANSFYELVTFLLWKILNKQNKTIFMFLSKMGDLCYSLLMRDFLYTIIFCKDLTN